MRSLRIKGLKKRRQIKIWVYRIIIILVKTPQIIAI